MADKIYNIILCQLETKHEEDKRRGVDKLMQVRKGRNKSDMVEQLATTRMIFYALMEDWMKAYTEAGFNAEINKRCLEIIAGSDLISNEMKSWIEKHHNGTDGKEMKKVVKSVISTMFSGTRFMKEAIGGQRFTKFCNSYPPSMLELIMMNQIRTLHKLKENYKIIKDQEGWPYERGEEKFSNDWGNNRKHLTVKKDDGGENKVYERPKSTMQIAPKTSINTKTNAGYITMSDAVKIFSTGELPEGVEADMLFHVVECVIEEAEGEEEVDNNVDVDGDGDGDGEGEEDVEDKKVQNLRKKFDTTVCEMVEELTEKVDADEAEKEIIVTVCLRTMVRIMDAQNKEEEEKEAAETKGGKNANRKSKAGGTKKRGASATTSNSARKRSRGKNNNNE